ncbi:uncharacterized protein MELLADRAFT_124209 [Melampsora larici-populina 98AG31]|uniref:Secreted protein n=1 Tax=Melampsora larici-populina (strain 98AG31 / pathotype 3-4-7) TaxID=747676 RepID=F4S8Q4_MELLP|nr:uncharacterized protein MELLADRAFT_124209 [Melampsora larici-populina 98AG31]EGF98983.1 secreted protein [Melampsora larici-populina 98AG31]
MMRIFSKSNLKDVFFLWAIFNLKFCVKGHPMTNALRVAEDAKSLGATSHGDDVLQVSSAFSHQTPDGRNIGATAAVKRPKTGLEDSEVAGAMGKGHLNSLDALHEQPNLSGSDGKLLASQVDDSKFTEPMPKISKSSKQPMEPNKGPVEDIPDKSPHVDESVKPATQNPEAANGQGSKIPGQDSKETSAAHSTLEASKANLKDAQPPSVKDTQPPSVKDAQPSSVKDTKENPVKSTPKNKKPTTSVASKGLLTPEALSKLSNTQYIKQAAASDKKVLQNYNKWMSAEEYLRDLRSRWFGEAKTTFIKSNGDALFDERMGAITQILKGSKGRGGSTDSESTIELAAQKEFIKEQAKNLKDEGLQRAVLAIKLAEQSAAKAESAALRSADQFFKRNKLLESSALRYKHTGWSFTKFFKKIFAWIFRLGRKGQQNKTSTTSVKNLGSPGKHTPKVSKQPAVEATSGKGVKTPGGAGLKENPSQGQQSKQKTTKVKTTTGDRPVGASEAATKDVTKPADQLEKDLVSPGKHTPEASTSGKSVNTPGDAELKENPSRAYRFWPSSWTKQASSAESPNRSPGYWESWLPWSGKKVQPVENEAQSVQNTASPNGWLSRFRSNRPPSEKALDPDDNYLGPFSRPAEEKIKVQPVENEAQSVQNAASPNGWFSWFRSNRPPSGKAPDPDDNYLGPF